MWRLVLLTLVLGAQVLPASAAPTVSTQTWQHRAADWTGGTFSETRVDNDALRLLPGHANGTFVAPPIQAAQPFSVLILEYEAHLERTHTLAIEIRSSGDGETWTEWLPLHPTWQHDQAPGHVLAFSAPQRWLQYRVQMTALFGSPVLDAVTFTVLDAADVPTLADLRSQPLAAASAADAPQAIPYEAWAGDDVPARFTPHQPRRIEIVPLAAAAPGANPVATLHTLQWLFQHRWQRNELPVHVILDAEGRLYNGAVPVAQRLPDTDVGVVRIGVLASPNGDIGEAARAQLVALTAWLVQTNDLHRDDVVASMVSAPFSDAVAEVRALVDQTIVRWRRVLVGGSGGADGVVLFNPASTDAYATLTAATDAGPMQHTVIISPGQRSDVSLAALFPPNTHGVVLEANRLLHAEQTISDGTHLVHSVVTEPARSWYFAAASTLSGTDTLLNVFNPAADAVDAQLVLYSAAADPITHTATLTPQRHTPFALRDLLPDAQFGVQLIAAQPVVADQIVQLPSGPRYRTGGSSMLQRRWLFAEGTTTAGYTTTLHLLNPWPQRVALTLHMMSEDGTSLTRRYAAPPHAHLMLQLNDLVPDLSFAFEVTADRPVVAERVIVNENGTRVSATIGSAAQATRWTFAGGTTLNTEQYLLVSNTARTATKADVRYILADGVVLTRRASVPPGARLTIHTNHDVADEETVTIVVTASQPVVVERMLLVPTPDGMQMETVLGDGGT